MATDPLSVLMPGLPDDQQAARQRIASVRNVAAAKIPDLDPGHALQLCWIITEVATAWLFRATSIETIEKVAEHCRRLLVVTDAAEEIEKLQ